MNLFSDTLRSKASPACTVVVLLAMLLFVPLLPQQAKAKATGVVSSDQAAAQHQSKNDMSWIPPGSFSMGATEPSLVDVRPVHQVHIDGFWMDRTEVTNSEFARFVHSTGYKTVAERKPEAKDFPGAPPENLVAGAMVFIAPAEAVSKHSHYNWWHYIPGADWQHPEGPTSNLKGLSQHPVVQIAWEDANAYAKWAGKRLPTEAEFEYASRGGLDRKQYAWGDELKPNGKWHANIWQGVFPYSNTAEDGYKTTAPVGSFPPNGYGLYDVCGNVWEWCSDWYRADYYKTLAASGTVPNNPQGPPDSNDPYEPNVQKKVLRGGSFLCTDQYCSRYLVGARGKGEPTSGCSNIGFRCAKTGKPPSSASH